MEYGGPGVDGVGVRQRERERGGRERREREVARAKRSRALSPLRRPIHQAMLVYVMKSSSE